MEGRLGRFSTLFGRLSIVVVSLGCVRCEMVCRNDGGNDARREGLEIIALAQESLRILPRWRVPGKS